MSNVVDTLIVELKAETKKLRTELDKVHKKLDKTKKKSEGVGKALKVMGGVVATIGLGKLASETVQTIRTFEDLEATLRAVTGGADGAAVSFEVIREFTKGTTFQIDEVAEAFIRLKQAGVVPTSEVLQDFGNLSAGMGKSITQLAQAAFNATTGEMEMLKQFGVKAKLEGNTIIATFDGVTKTIDRSGDAIIDYLRSLGRESFPTAIEERLNTLSGAISNLGDASSEFMVAIGEGGLKTSLTNLSKEFTRVLGESEPLANMIGKVLGTAFDVLGRAILVVLDNINLLISAMLGLGAIALLKSLSSLGLAFVALTIKIRATFAATAALIGLSGPAGWAVIATAVGVATTAYLALEKATEQNNKVAKDKVKLDEELNEKVKVTKDVVKQLTTANKDLVASFKNLNTETEVTLNSILQNTLGFAGATQKIEEMYQTFRDEQLQKIKDEQSKDPQSFFSITGQLRTEDIGDFDKFREDFYKEVFGMSGDQVKRLLNIAVIAPVEDVKEQLKEVFTKDDDPFQALRDAYEDPTALKALYDEQVALGEFEGTLTQFKKAITDFLTINDTQLTAVEESLKSIFEAGAKGDLEVATDAIENNSEALKNLYDKLLLIDDEFKKLGLTFEQFKQQYEDGVASMNDKTNDLVPTLSSELKTAITQTANAFSNEFVDSLMEGEDALESFKDFSDNIVKQIISVFLQLAVVNRILNNIFGAGTFDQYSFKDGFQPAKTSAGGGSAYNNQPMLVGERGPEIFVPHTNGNILNNMNSKRAVGGGATTVINQSINFATGVVPTVRAEVTKMLPQIAEVTKSAVQESAMRGGSFRRSLVGG